MKMAKLPSWMQVIETQDKGRTVVLAIRWWHPHVWGLLWGQCRMEILERGRNPNHVAMRWLMVKTVVKTVWEQSKKSWTF
jgi:hypothetical protein